MTWTEAEEKFAENFVGYEPRLPQRGLALAIEDALNSEEHIFAQAPCGVGKSYAGMVPAVDLSLKLGQPVGLAPGTKALQDQYIGDAETLKSIYRDFEYVVAKGRSNYLCRAKMAKLDEVLFGLNTEDLLKAAAQEGINGDLDRLGIDLSPQQRRELSMSSDECPGKKSCPFGSSCFAESVKEKAKTANVVIVNHALIAIDALLKAQGIEMLPQFGALIIDEVQEFEGYVTNALSSSVSESSFTSAITEVANFLGDRSIIGPANLKVANLFSQLRKVMDARPDKRESTVQITPSLLLECQDELLGAHQLLGELDAKLSLFRAGNEDDSMRKRRLQKRVAGLADKMRSIILTDFSEVVRWVELEVRENYRTRERDERILLAQAPLDVAPFLANAIWPWQPVVFMSATISVGEDFTYMAKELGVEEYRTFDCESPFDFTTQAMTYVGKGLPDPSTDPAAFRAAVNLNITELVRASDGRALLLFTSWAGLNAAYDAVTPVIQSMGHRVFKQGQGGSPRELAQAFKADEHSVLFAVKSFFTGVDIQGDSLRLVVIDKLPFPVKDVLFAARCDAKDAKLSPNDKFKYGSFMTMWVPKMIITLLQGYGRGIRSRSDRALIAILDPRTHSKPSYGRKVLKVIPQAPQVTTLPEAVAYLHSLEVVDA